MYKCGDQGHRHGHDRGADQAPHLSGQEHRLHRGVQQMQQAVHRRDKTHSRTKVGRTSRIREEPEAGPSNGSALQPPGPQHGRHHVFRPGEDQQRQPPVQEGQGVLLHRKIQFKIRGDECQEIEPEKNCKLQLSFLKL